MPLAKLEFRPGIVRDQTEYTNTGGWFSCDKVRFREGVPEKIGGWQRFSQERFLGTARSLFAWATLVGEQLYALGTHLKYYVVRGGEFIDVTPIRTTTALGNDPFTTTAAGSRLVAVAAPAHGAVPNDFVTFSGATGPIDGIPASEFNREHQIVDLSDTDAGNAYVIQVDTAAAAGSVSGGGAAVQAEYQINTGLDTTVLGLGWGADPWGFGGWGAPAVSLAVGDRLRLWHEDNFGEDLVFNVRDGGIYYKDVSSINDRAILLADHPLAVDVPTVATQILVSNNDRHVIAFGANDVGQSEQDPLLARWSNQENVFNWNQLGAAATAGSLRFNQGSRIIRGIETQREILVFTDVSLHSFRFLGSGSFVFGQTVVGTNVSLIAPNAVVTNGSSLFWMGQGKFYVYTGAVQEIPCPLRDFIFRDLNNFQLEKITAGVNRRESEIIWFMPRNGAEGLGENNFYVIFNYKQNIWYYGTMERTVWIDSQFEPRPLAASTQGYLLAHEVGNDDAEAQPAQPINAFIQSSEFEIGDGERFMLVNRIIPDITFVQSTAQTPGVVLTLTPVNYPGATSGEPDARAVARGAQVPLEEFDDFRSVRVRGRAMQYRIESTAMGVGWRHGSTRLDMRPDGRK